MKLVPVLVAFSAFARLTLADDAPLEAGLIELHGEHLGLDDLHPRLREVARRGHGRITISDCSPLERCTANTRNGSQPFYVCVQTSGLKLRFDGVPFTTHH